MVSSGLECENSDQATSHKSASLSTFSREAFRAANTGPLELRQTADLLPQEHHNTTDSPQSVDFPIQNKRNRTKESIIEANTIDCHARPNARQVKSRHAAGPSALRVHGPLEYGYDVIESY